MIAVADDDRLALGCVRVVSCDRCRGCLGHGQVVACGGLKILARRWGLYLTLSPAYIGRRMCLHDCTAASARDIFT